MDIFWNHLKETREKFQQEFVKHQLDTDIRLQAFKSKLDKNNYSTDSVNYALKKQDQLIDALRLKHEALDLVVKEDHVKKMEMQHVKLIKLE